MKFNYPVKYAAMPIIEQIGWTPGLHELERDYAVVCYIVSKCYLINESKIYKESGGITKKYEIVFPYQHHKYSIWVREFPDFKSVHGHCTNSIKVDKIFDSYEEALKYINIENDNLCEQSLVYLPFSENLAQKIQEKKDHFKLKLANYMLLEKQILLYTEDMQVGKHEELNDVIRINNSDVKILSANIYNVLTLWNNESFTIYIISHDEYKRLTTLIKNGKYNNKINIVLQEILFHKQNGKITQVLTEAEFRNNLKKTSLSFYTTEKIEDLLNIYKEYPEIDLNSLEVSS